MGVGCFSSVVTKGTKRVLFVTIIMAGKSYSNVFAPSLPVGRKGGTLECASKMARHLA